MLNRIGTTAEMEALLLGGTRHVLHRDFETRSLAILKKVGTYKYATDSSTTVLCGAFAVDGGPVQLWTPSNPTPAAFIEAATDPTWVLAAHNDAFETAIEQYILAPRYSWPAIPLERHVCTQARCLTHGLPARLSERPYNLFAGACAGRQTTNR